jgi:hypothetical protein
MKAANSFKFTRGNVQQVAPLQVLNLPDEEIESTPIRHLQAIKLEACDKPKTEKKSKFQRK